MNWKRVQEKPSKKLILENWIFAIRPESDTGVKRTATFNSKSSSQKKLHSESQ